MRGGEERAKARGKKKKNTKRVKRNNTGMHVLKIRRVNNTQGMGKRRDGKTEGKGWVPAWEVEGLFKKRSRVTL